jgi:hypothetical protein
MIDEPGGSKQELNLDGSFTVEGGTLGESMRAVRYTTNEDADEVLMIQRQDNSLWQVSDGTKLVCISPATNSASRPVVAGSSISETNEEECPILA